MTFIEKEIELNEEEYDHLTEEELAKLERTLKWLRILIFGLLCVLAWFAGILTESIINKSDKAVYMRDVEFIENETFSKGMTDFFNEFKYRDEVDIVPVKFPNKDELIITVGAYVDSYWTDEIGLIMLELYPDNEPKMKSAFIHEYAHHLTYKFEKDLPFITKTRKDDHEEYEKQTDYIAYYMTKARKEAFYPGYVVPLTVNFNVNQNKELKKEIKFLLDQEGIVSDEINK